jgi:pimeloyl-ACP methyl ester carboxylesterase
MKGGARSVLLGWGNAAPSQLVAYQRLHRTLGLDAAFVIPDTLRGLARSDAHARSLAPLAAELAAEAGARPIIVHLFSDNGFVGWAALLDALAETPGGRAARAAIRGVVVDSAPGLWAVRGRIDFARRFALGMTPAVSRLMKQGARERIPLVTPLLAAGFVGYQLLFPRQVKVLLSASERIAARQPRCPHLFLYGEQDVLVPPRDVRAWIEKQRSAGIDVEEHAFPEARHVALFPNDPKRYRAALTRFFDRVL